MNDNRPKPASESRISELLEIMVRLRDPGSGCPWDRQQDFSTIAPYTVEEAYEVAEAISRGDLAELKEELGDLLFQVVFHARMAEEQDAFGFVDVVGAIVDKMVRRHPHVFAGEDAGSGDEQNRSWEAHKAAERRAKGQPEPSSRLDGVSRGLPAMQRAWKLQKRAASAGFDWPDAAALMPKLREEIKELEAALSDEAGHDAQRDELGDLLFSCVNLARHLGVDPEQALRGANAKFERRFRRVEQLTSETGARIDELSLDELDELWEQAKAQDRR